MMGRQGNRTVRQRGHKATRQRSRRKAGWVAGGFLLLTAANWAWAGQQKSNTSSVLKLAVQGELVEAHELWLPYMETLLRKARESSRRDFEEYVARESAELITEKIAEMLLYQRAKLRLTDAMEKKIGQIVDAEIRKRATEKYGGVQRRMERDLEQQGWTLDGFRTHMRRSIIISSWLDDEIRPQVAEPTRAELMAAFRETSESLRKAPRRSMSLIDVRVSEFLPKEGEVSDEQKAQARALASAHVNQAQAELRKGVAFTEVARKYSHASNAPDGGSWGFVNPESVQDRFQPAVAALQRLLSGQVSEVISTEDGFFLVRCDELDPGTNPDFVSIQPQLRGQLFTRAYNKRIAELVADLKKSAKIEPQNLESFHRAVVLSALSRVPPG